MDLLRRYLQVDTTNPPGNELKAALFFKEVLEREGIPVEVDEFAPGRANLLATAQGHGARRPLILANHMDVVARRSRALVGAPLLRRGEGRRDLRPRRRGHEDGGHPPARGPRSAPGARRCPLSRDILFLATADEEAGFLGALRAISPEGWRDRLEGAEYLITEGGENIVTRRARSSTSGWRPRRRARSG